MLYKTLHIYATNSVCSRTISCCVSVVKSLVLSMLKLFSCTYESLYNNNHGNS